MKKRIFISAAAICLAMLLLSGCASLTKVAKDLVTADETKADGTTGTVTNAGETEAESEAETEAEETEAATKAAKADTEGKNTVGDTAEGKYFSFTLVSVDQNDKGEYYSADEGKVFVHCQFEIENVTSEEKTFSTLLNSDGYCDDVSLDYSFSATMANPNGDNGGGGTLAAGKKMMTTISYEVPADWQVIEIELNDDFLTSDDKVYFAVTADDVK